MSEITDVERYMNQLKRMNVLIKDWDSLNEFLKQNMPGQWSRMHITKLVQRLPGHERFIVKNTGRTECVETMNDEVTRLLEIVNFQSIRKILEPFDGTGTISNVLKKSLSKDVKIITNDICPEHGNPELCENALDNKLYNEIGQVDAIITSPWFVMLDIAIPLMLKHCKSFLAIHCPSYYMTNAPNPRLKFIKKLAKENRVISISSMTRNNPTRMSCIWLVIFKDEDEKKKRLMNSNMIVPIIF